MWTPRTDSSDDLFAEQNEAQTTTSTPMDCSPNSEDVEGLVDEQAFDTKNSMIAAFEKELEELDRIDHGDINADDEVVGDIDYLMMATVKKTAMDNFNR